MTDITFFGHGFGQTAGTYEYDTALPAGTTVGTDGNDLIIGGQFSSVIEGGEGNDILVGGQAELQTKGGNAGQYKIIQSGDIDTFVFNFTVAKTEGSVFYFRPNEDGTGGDTPNSNANVQSWTNYLDQLDTWRAEMENQYGVDADTCATGEAIATVKKTTVDLGDYDNSFEIAGSLEITSHDGSDVIIDFGAEDKLDLKGLSGITFNDFDTLFDVASNGKATTLAWEGGSITINGLDVVDDASFFSLTTSKGWFTGDFV